MKGNALIVAVSSLVAMLGLSKRKHRTDRPSHVRANGTLGDDAMTVAVLCGGVHL